MDKILPALNFQLGASSYIYPVKFFVEKERSEFNWGILEPSFPTGVVCIFNCRININTRRVIHAKFKSNQFELLGPFVELSGQPNSGLIHHTPFNRHGTQPLFLGLLVGGQNFYGPVDIFF